MTTRQIMDNLTLWRGLAAVVLLVGTWATIVRFTQGLGAATNLSDGFPWGIWIGFDVLVGVGVAAGGFTLTAAVHLFNLERFRPIIRPTVLTAFLGYLMVIIGLLFDLGRPYRVWHPIIMWNPHSVMFEVAWCVTLYTTVLALEFSPMVLERFKLRRALHIVEAIAIPTVILGVLLSTLHQSSLGTLFVIVPDKLHGLWYSPLLPVFFFVSAIAAGLAMVIVESSLSSYAFGRRLELDLLQQLGRVIVVVLALYLAIKVQDMLHRDAFGLIDPTTPEGFLFLVEVVFGAVVPMLLLAVPAVRADRGGLLCAALLVVLGFVLNRLNVSITGIQRAMAADYFPSVLEVSVTGALVVGGFIAFAMAVRFLPVFPESSPEHDRPFSSLKPSRAVVLASRGSLVALAGVLILGLAVLDPSVASKPVVTAAEPTAIEFVQLRLPEALTFARSEESPGPVEFSHESHVDAARPSCAPCHAGAMPIIPTGAAPTLTGEVLHGTTACGACHNGEQAFSIDEECGACHVEE
ncbi:MAG: NrfD/PsrC family molybdoenzyme membrane anchor subunit [Gemmatimonadota bacterium]